jgi:hypothetical protein
MKIDKSQLLKSEIKILYSIIDQSTSSILLLAPSSGYGSFSNSGNESSSSIL